jgi:DNA-binding transcriptional ArsR family regulator
VRVAVGVACAVRELALDPDRRRWSEHGAEMADPLRPVPLDTAALSERAGVSPRDVEASLALLASARVVTLQYGAAAATVALSEAVLAPLPAVARVAWPAVRSRLLQVEASSVPALAVLRELAAQLGALDDGAEVPPLRISVRALEDATGFGRSTVSEALAALERARLLDIETRAGRTTRFSLRPAAFGRADEPPRVMPEGAGLGDGMVPASVAGEGSSGAAVAPPSPAVMVNPAANSGTGSSPRPGVASVLVGEFAGTPIYAPPGTALVVECDDQGRWSCRVGPFLQLGPVSTTE